MPSVAPRQIAEDTQQEYGNRHAYAIRSGIFFANRTEQHMRCINPACDRETSYLRDGSLYLLELETLADSLFESENSGFPMRSLPQKFFWLCGDCAGVFKAIQWTPSGVLLRRRARSTDSMHSQQVKLAVHRAAPAGLPSSQVKSA